MRYINLMADRETTCSTDKFLWISFSLVHLVNFTSGLLLARWWSRGLQSDLIWLKPTLIKELTNLYLIDNKNKANWKSRRENTNTKVVKAQQKQRSDKSNMFDDNLGHPNFKDQISLKPIKLVKEKQGNQEELAGDCQQSNARAWKEECCEYRVLPVQTTRTSRSHPYPRCNKIPFQHMIEDY